ncbi:hypothetical protein [Halomonas sp. MS1]|nr:hypothetical protein [Halomonas sp. MS1]UTD54907.1 hypothetical protein NF683_17435 [Halomonas sp. MS1]
MTEWILGILAGLIGAFIGNWFALGRDLRKERNDARYPIWKWLDANKPDYGEKTPFDEGSLNEALQKYKNVARETEWARFKQHHESIKEIRKRYAPSGRDLCGQPVDRERDPKSNELESIKYHWSRMVQITRHRKII